MKVIITTFLTFLLASQSVYAITLTEYRSAALAENGNVTASALAIEASRQDVEVARSQFDVSLNASGVYGKKVDPAGSYLPIGKDTYRYGLGLSKKVGTGTLLSVQGSAVASDLETSGDYSSSTASISIRQPLLKGFGLSVNDYAEDMARFGVASSEYESEQVVEKVGYRAAVLFQAATYFRSVHHLQERSVAMVEELLEATTERVSAGLATQSDVLEVKAELLARKQQLNNARASLEGVISEMSALAGGVVLVASEIPSQEILSRTPSAYELKELASRDRAVLKLAANAVEASGRDLQQKSHNKLPQADLVLSGGLNGSSTLADSRESWDVLGDDDANYWSAGVELTFPLGNRAAKAEEVKSRALKNLAASRLYQLRLQVYGEIDSALANYLAIKSNLELATSAKEVAAQGLDFELLRMNEGLSDTYRVLRFQQRSIDAEAQMLTAIYNNNISWHAIEMAVGVVE